MTRRTTTVILTTSLPEKGQMILLGDWPHTVKTFTALGDGRWKVILMRGL